MAAHLVKCLLPPSSCHFPTHRKFCSSKFFVSIDAFGVVTKGCGNPTNPLPLSLLFLNYQSLSEMVKTNTPTMLPRLWEPKSPRALLTTSSTSATSSWLPLYDVQTWSYKAPSFSVMAEVLARSPRHVKAAKPSRSVTKLRCYTHLP
jgi:hypothetical protein